MNDSTAVWCEPWEAARGAAPASQHRAQLQNTYRCLARELWLLPVPLIPRLKREPLKPVAGFQNQRDDSSLLGYNTPCPINAPSAPLVTPSLHRSIRLALSPLNLTPLHLSLTRLPGCNTAAGPSRSPTRLLGKSHHHHHASIHHHTPSQKQHQQRRQGVRASTAGRPQPPRRAAAAASPQTAVVWRAGVLLRRPPQRESERSRRRKWPAESQRSCQCPNPQGGGRLGERHLPRSGGPGGRASRRAAARAHALRALRHRLAWRRAARALPVRVLVPARSPRRCRRQSHSARVVCRDSRLTASAAAVAVGLEGLCSVLTVRTPP